ncbi:MAG: dipicolinate synthase, partial [Oscillospiraceae bacterium]|nr:dipicolinate synthase [Oscillospiraceae bacterium]
MKYAVIGGDRRAALLAGLLLREGHRVHSWALERAQLPEEVPRSGSLQAALYGADAVLLPLPAARGELLNAPFAARPCPMAELEEALWPGQLVFGGGFTEAQRLRAERSGLTLIDWLRRPALVIGNAAITAEGAVGLLLQESERTLAGSRALVLGYGRIGRVLARLLTA